MKRIKKFYKNKQKLRIQGSGAVIFIKTVNFKKVLV